MDHAVKIRLNATTQRVEMKNIKMAVNPFCEIAMEQAVRLREAKVANEVVPSRPLSKEQIIAVSIGVKAAQEQLRYCMALGADRGLKKRLI